MVATVVPLVRYPLAAVNVLPWTCSRGSPPRHVFASFNDLPAYNLDSCKKQDGPRPRLQWYLGTAVYTTTATVVLLISSMLLPHYHAVYNCTAQYMYEI
jgi:hypothetical protein